MPQYGLYMVYIGLYWFILVYIGLYYMLIYVNLCSSNTTVDHGTHKSWLNHPKTIKW